MRTNQSFRLSLLAAATALCLAGCAVGPAYQRPTVAEPAAFKELKGWVQAAPADALDRGPWWTLFKDPVLDGLMPQVEVSNQNVAAAVAAYAQARAIVAEQRAALFPLVSLNTNGTRSGQRTQPGATGNNFRLSVGTTWDADVWGRLRAGVTAATASAQASAADLASARLSAQAELATDYFMLRSADAQRATLFATIQGYERLLKITQNSFNAGIAAHSDVYQAETTLANARSQDLGLAIQRAQLEHAIAVLVGKAPADFSIAVANWNVTVPDVPVVVPSLLLQRRPDIAAAEREVAIANAQIGIARAAYYPDISLTSALGTAASGVGSLFSASAAAWSFGLSATQTLFDAGATRASVAAARAVHEQAVANYRQTVLTAFANVEDQLTATHLLVQQQDQDRVASEASDKVEKAVTNQYNAGQVEYSTVVQAQVTALNARSTLIQVQASRQTTAIALIQALGGGWHAEDYDAPKSAAAKP
jgi:NodT family efflux transporter outer membrane factor (OMF) lipoprotein